MKISMFAATMALAMSVAGVAEAGRYQVYRVTNDSLSLVDSLTKTRTGSVISVWQADLYAQAEKVAGRDFSRDQWVSQFEYDCAKRTYRIGKETAYLDGKLAFNGTSGWGAWNPAIPESVGETMLMNLCDASFKHYGEWDSISDAFEHYRGFIAAERAKESGK